MKKNKFLKEIIAIIILLPIISTPFLTNTNSGVIKYLQKLSGSNCLYLDLNLFHGDENHWLINAERYSKLFFIYKNTNSSQWERFSAYDQPPVGKYVMGLAMFAAGSKDEIKKLEQIISWDFAKDYEWNVANGAIPPKGLLHIARLTMALFGIFTCLLIYYIGRRAFGVKTGIIASLLLAYNPLMVSCSRRAMPDALFLFFLATNIILIMFFYPSFLKQNLQKTIVFAVLIGINAALAAGTKLNGVLTAIIFASFCVIIILVKALRHKSEKRPLINITKITASLLTSVFIAIIVFVSINPYLYKQPFKRMTHLIEHRTMMAQGQQRDNPEEALTSLGVKIKSVVKRTMFPGNYVVLGSILKIPIDFCLFILGLIMLLHAEIKYLLENRSFSSKSIILVWTITSFILITVWLPLDWDRYYLPLILCMVTMQGYVIARIIDKCWETFNKIVVLKMKTWEKFR